MNTRSIINININKPLQDVGGDVLLYVIVMVTVSDAILPSIRVVTEQLGKHLSTKKCSVCACVCVCVCVCVCMCGRGRERECTCTSTSVHVSVCVSVSVHV